jgi:hypothetical protein
MFTIKSLKNIHEGEDIYVIGSGASLNHLDPSFFDGCVTIGVNQVYKYYPNCTYLVRKEMKFINEARATGSKVVFSKYDSGNYNNPLNTQLCTPPNDECYFFEHLNNQHTEIDTSVIGTDKLVVSFSTITSAIHLAAYMGATNIYIAGHDCGTVDGKWTVDGYYDGIQDTPWQNWEQYKAWLKIIEGQTVKLRDALKRHYGCNVVSINPFVSLNLEGHVFR